MPESVIPQVRKNASEEPEDSSHSAKRPKKHHVPRSTVFVPTLTRAHPLRIRPSGNALLLPGKSENGSQPRSRTDTLGPYFGLLPDELLMTILQDVEQPRDLLALGHTCKAMFAYCWNDELWKHMVYRDPKKRAPKKWHGTWRRTFWGMTAPKEKEEGDKDQNKAEKSEEARVDCRNIVFSDLLYRPFQCAQIDYKKILERALQEDIEEERENGTGESKLIPIFKEDDMTLTKYNEEWYSKPFMLNLTTPIADWTVDNLVERFSDTVFRQEYMDWTLKVYNEYMQDNNDESPLYLFDCRSEAMRPRTVKRRDPETGKKTRVKVGGELSQEYRMPASVFTGENNDVFTVFGSQVRPNHRWLIVGPARSGSSFHKDPNATSAWNVVLTGHKYWIMFPSNRSGSDGVGQALPPPPGVGTDAAESEVTAPVSIAEWFQSGYYDLARVTPGFCHGICGPGQMVHVPGGWWHLVVNLDECMALTGNFVPVVRVPDVIDFLHNKHDQISGFRWKSVEHALATGYSEEYGSGSNEDRKAVKEEDDEEDDDEDDDQVRGGSAMEEDDDECGCDDGVDMSKYVFYLFVRRILQSGNSEFVGALSKAFVRMPLLMLLRDREHVRQLEQAKLAEQGDESQQHAVSKKWQKLVGMSNGKGEEGSEQDEQSKQSRGGFSFGFEIEGDELNDEAALFE